MARQYFETCNTTTITLAASSWTYKSNRYYQKATNAAIKANDTPEVSIVYPITNTSTYVLSDDDKKATQKAASFIYLLVTANGYAYVYAVQQPTIDITLELKGVSG